MYFCFMKRRIRGHLLTLGLLSFLLCKWFLAFSLRIYLSSLSLVEGGHVIQLCQRVHSIPLTTGMLSRTSSWNKVSQSEQSPEHLLFRLPLKPGEWRTGVADNHFCHQVDTDNEGDMKESRTQVWREYRLLRQSLSPWFSLCPKPTLYLLHMLTSSLFTQASLS